MCDVSHASLLSKHSIAAFSSHLISSHLICLQVSGGMMTHISDYLVALLCGEEVKRFNLFAIQVTDHGILWCPHLYVGHPITSLVSLSLLLPQLAPLSTVNCCIELSFSAPSPVVVAPCEFVCVFLPRTEFPRTHIKKEPALVMIVPLLSWFAGVGPRLASHRGIC